MDGVVRARLVDAETGGEILRVAAFREPVRVGDSVVVRAQGGRLGGGWKDGDVGTVVRIARAVAPADDDVHLRRVAPPTPPAAAAPPSGRAAAAAWPLPQAGVVDPWTHRRACWHESGHVVVAHALGATPTAASVAAIGTVGPRELGSVEAPNRTSLRWHEQALLALAGRAAEDLVGLPPRPWREGDPDLAHYRTARWFAAGQPPVPIAAMDRYLEDDMRTVRLMLRQREEVVERIARALLDRGRLGAAELAELLGTEPRRAPVAAVPAQDAAVPAVPGGKALFTGVCQGCGATYTGPSRTRCPPCALGRR